MSLPAILLETAMARTRRHVLRSLLGVICKNFEEILQRNQLLHNYSKLGSHIRPMLTVLFRTLATLRRVEIRHINTSLDFITHCVKQ